MLVEAFLENPQVQPMKMSCETDETTGDVKFLYKFEKGYTTKSEGIYVAKMALIPKEILKRAEQQSDIFKKKLKQLEQKVIKKTK